MVQPQGQVMGKYEILGEIGRGGFATVYRAVDTTLGREVALKVLDPLLMRDEAFVARFRQEARAAAGLEHPHIVPIYEVGEADGRLYIAMRLVRGPSLAERLKGQGCIPWDETLDILRQVGDALTYAHEREVIHRDIKPQNILLDPRNGAMLTDFGFARLVGTSTLTQSLSGGIVGTPSYIAPEIWEGKQATPAGDVYALACVTYEMLTGAMLFQNDSPMAVMRAHDRGPQFPATWPDGVPDGVDAALRQALDREAQDRPQDARLLAQMFAQVRSEAAGQASRVPGPRGAQDQHPREWLPPGLGRWKNRTLGHLGRVWGAVGRWANSGPGAMRALKWTIAVVTGILWAPVLLTYSVLALVYWAPLSALWEIGAFLWRVWVGAVRQRHLARRPLVDAITVYTGMGDMLTSTRLEAGGDYTISVTGTVSADRLGTPADAIGVLGHPGRPPYLCIDGQYRRPDVIADPARHRYSYSQTGTGSQLILRVSYPEDAAVSASKAAGGLYVEVRKGVPWASRDLAVTWVVLLGVFTLMVIIIAALSQSG